MTKPNGLQETMYAAVDTLPPFDDDTLYDIAVPATILFTGVRSKNDLRDRIERYLQGERIDYCGTTNLFSGDSSPDQFADMRIVDEYPADDD